MSRKPALGALDLKGCFGKTPKTWFKTARYSLKKNGKVLRAGLSYADARALRQQAEAAEGLSPLDKHNPYAIELENQKEASQALKACA